MDLLSGLGIRAERRMTPRVGIALAGAGAAIAIVGALGIGGDNLVDDDGDITRIPGVLISLALLAIGTAVLQRIRSGPLATGASVAAAIGIPALLVFLTAKDSYPGFAFDATILVATVAWAAAYLVGPARGRLLFVTLALVGLPLFVLEQVEDISSLPAEIGNAFAYSMFGATSSFDDQSFGEGSSIEGELEDQFTDDFEPPVEPDLPDPTTVGGILLGFGVAYAATSHLLSRRGYDGAGTPFAPLAVLQVALGISLLGNDLGETGGGLALLAAGLALAFVGAMAARRFTTWAGAALTANGIIVLVGEAIGDQDDATVAFTIYLLTGLAVVFAAHLLVEGIGEAAEEDQRRSLRPETSSSDDEGPGAPRAGHEPGPPPDEIWAPPTST